MLDWDLDDDEYTMEVDNSAADFTGGWFAVEVVGSVCTQYVNERGKSITARVTFKIVDDETFDGTSHAGTLYVEYLDDAAYFVFLDEQSFGSEYQGPYHVTEGTFFVVGDNRAMRMEDHTFGATERARIVGRVML